LNLFNIFENQLELRLQLTVHLLNIPLLLGHFFGLVFNHG